ncbi:hypothetical protein LCGC14_2207410, partial [marine sediment metagenome]
TCQAHAAAEETARSRPNVVLIMTDDQGYGDLSCHGNPWLKTPNLDRLASQSIRLDDYHVSPYCIPTRAALMTGRYADRTGVHNVLAPHWFARTNEVMLSRMFQDAGYATGMFGKWHLGDNYPYGPEHRGFGEVLHHYGGAGGGLNDYWNNSYVDDTYYGNNDEPTKVNGYCTDVFFSAATRFINNAAEHDKPFFLYLTTNAPHGPYICDPAYSKPYAEGKTRNVANFYGMIANIDKNVGTLRKFLKEKGIDRNTIFIFTTDNGTAAGHTVFNAGMRGNKFSPYDGGHRVPFFLHWPDGGFAEQRRIQTLTAHIDIAPTLLDLCGIARPDGVKFDGVSIRPLLEKGDHKEWPDRIIMTDTQYNGPPKKWVTAVLSERWRLVGGRELYDIDADPGQKKNVYAEHPEVVQRLSSFYDALWEEMKPTFKDVAEIPLGHPRASHVALNYHDCIGRHKFWFQDGIRRITDKIDPPESKRRRAFWPVNVVTEGEYTIELRRWPKELGAAIRANIPPGDKVYGRPAFRTTPGMGFPAVEASLSIGGRSFTEPVDDQAKGITFRVELPKGSHRLSARFIDAERRSLDAFYAYVTKSE